MARYADHRDAQASQRASYTRPAQQALEAGEWEAVRSHIDPWLQAHKDDADAQALWCESYYRPGKRAFEAKDLESAIRHLERLLSSNQGYQDAMHLVQTAYYGRLPTKTHTRVPKLEFVQVPTGGFLYGENKQRMGLDTFWIARAPLTNAQYKVFVEATKYTAPSHWDSGRIPTGKESHPVVNVSWDDAQAFCRWAGVRLPTEREWEKAARGTDGRTYPWGEAAPNGELCNFNNLVGDTTAVGGYTKGVSPYGLLDMAGNVWEWCEDWYETGKTRVLRGGAFDTD